jgi:4-amino-4-deoxy-L-arabinose transferase-like glycosyltransferase
VCRARVGAGSVSARPPRRREGRPGHSREPGLAELPFFAGEEGRGRLIVLLFFISASVVLVWGTWQGVLPASDEAVLAETAQEILTTGNALTLHFDGRAVHDTPPFAPWLMSFFLLLFGVNIFAARFGFVLLSVASFYLIYVAGVTASQDWGGAGETADASDGAGPGRSRWGSLPAAIGFLSAIILASTPLFGRFTSHITAGLPFAFFTGLALLGWLMAPNGRLGAPLWGIGIAGAMLSAGSGAFFIVLGGILASLVDRSRRALVRKPMFILATLVGVLVGGLWLFPATMASGDGFWRSPVWAPVAGILKPRPNVAPTLLRSVKTAWLACLPWAIAATIAAGRVFFSSGRKRRSAQVSDVDDGLLVFSTVMFLPWAMAGVDSTSQFLPAIPGMAIVSAREVARWMRRPGKSLTKRVWTVDHGLTALFCLLMLLVVATPLRLRVVRNDPIRDIARMAERLTPPGTRIGNFRQQYPEQCARMLFYGNRSLERPLMDPTEVAGALRADPRMLFLSTVDDMAKLRGLEASPVDIHVLYGAGNLVLFGRPDSGLGETR